MQVDEDRSCGPGHYQITTISWWTCTLEKANFWLAGIVFKLVGGFISNVMSMGVP